MAQLLQIAGAVVILIAYGLAQLRRLDSHSYIYFWLNFIGSVILSVLAGIGRQWGFLLLEGVWAAISLGSIVARFRKE